MPFIHTQKIYYTLGLLLLVCVSPLVCFSAADYGVKASEVSSIQQIQKQLTQEYIDSTHNSLAIQKTEEKMLDSKIEGLMLEDVIAGYDSDISVLEKKILPIFEQIREPKQQIATLEDKKNTIREALAQQGKILSSLYLEMLFQNADSKKTFSDSLLSSVFLDNDEQRNQQITEEAIKKIEKKVLSTYADLLKEFNRIQSDQAKIQQSIAGISQEYKELTDRRDKIEQQKMIKEEQLLAAQKTKEHYADLLTESREQAFASMEEAMSSDTVLQELQKKIDDLETQKNKKEATQTAARMQDIKLKEEYSPEELTTDMLAAISKKVIDESKGNLFFELWPVSPDKGISATFHDASYKKRFGMQHNAIDIPAPQGTDILAPADGYVYKTVDNGLGYSYIIILHRNNVRTVYGHVSKFLVSPGDMVVAGEAIGKVGGTPGTKGAGKMTTGPHLHFEVLVNEVYKNPEMYLPAR